MATQVPAPVLDARNGDLVTAEAIGSLPSELSDRSNSNPAVVFLEAAGAMFDKLIFQVNQWASTGVIQKVLNLIGVTLIPATGASVSQTFTLSAPQPQDTIIPTGTQVGPADGSLVFSSLSDASIRSYLVPVGTISFTAGSTGVTGAGTTFLSDVQAGWQISTNASTWYTVLNVTNDTTLTLATSATSTVSGSAYFAGPISTTATVQCTTTGLSTNIAASKLNTLLSQPGGVASTVNNAAATLGTDLETVTQAVARAPQAFTARDSACSVSDYEYFARKVLGANSRAKAFANTNNTAYAPGYVTFALLSPAWSTSSSVSAQERASVVRDLVPRSFVGVTLTDVAANIQRFDTGTAFPAVLVWRKSNFDETTVRLRVAAALNNLFNPNTYPWGRTIYTTDIVQAVEAVQGVDRVHSINGIPAAGTIYQTSANAITLTAQSNTGTVNAADTGAGKITAGVTYIIDATSKAGYLVTAVSGTSITLATPAVANTSTVLPYMNTGDTVLANAYTLPYSNLSTVTAPPSVIVVGSVAA